MNTLRRSLQIITLSLIFLMLDACAKNQSALEKEIEETESEFAQMASEKGIPEAFIYFAADNAVILRNNSIIRGKDSIKIWFSQQSYSNISLTWKPDFIDVSESGDLAYTYGKYTYSIIDSTGKERTSSGIFHTVWKKQPDGSWKYVWD